MRVVVIGGSVAGLHAALAFARGGHDVTVLERDRCDLRQVTWRRPGAPQLSQSHAFLGQYVQLLRRNHPELLGALLSAGARLVPLTPPAHLRLAQAPTPELVVLTTRRALLEAAVRAHVAATPGVRLRYGVGVRGLEVSPAVVPTVTGVRTDEGVQPADLVVDAAGQRSRVAAWLGLPPEPGQPCGSIYFTRHYRHLRAARDRAYNLGFVDVTRLDALTVLVFPGEHDTFTVSIQVDVRDGPLRRLREPQVFERALRAVPAAAGRVGGAAVPLSGVHVHAGVRHHLRRFVTGRSPVVTGIQRIGDALCVTSPSFGHGVARAAASAYRLAELAALHTGDDLTLAFDAAVEQEVAPHYRLALALDTRMQREMRPKVGAATCGGGDGLRAEDESLCRGWDRVCAVSEVDPDVWYSRTRAELLLGDPRDAVARAARSAAPERSVPPAQRESGRDCVLAAISSP